MRPSTSLVPPPPKPNRTPRKERPALTRARTRTLGAVAILLGTAAGMTACTSILGDFKVGAAVGDGGPGDGATGNDVVTQTDTGSDAPVTSTTLDDAIQVAAGEKHTCALRKDRTVYCWGDNTRGQLGTSAVGTSSTKPVKVANLKLVRAIAAGSQHTCALTFDPSNPASGGRVLCWGDNTLRQLGKPTPDMSFDPLPVGKPGVTTASPPDWTTAAAITSGQNTNCGADTGGGLYCWGDNSAGQFGTGTTSPLKSEVPTAPTPSVLLQGAEIAAGGTQACAVGTTSGVTEVSAICWGGGQHGEVGNGLTGAGPYAPSWAARGTSDAGAAPFKHVAAGHTHSCTIDGNLDVFCWGSNDFGESGPSSTTGAPHPVPGLVPTAHGALAVGAGEQSTCVLSNDNFKVKCWGKNTFGEIGNSTTDSTGSAPQTQPQEVSGLTGAGQISVGARHVCAVIKAIPQPGVVDDKVGTVMCWGSGENGRLGNGTIDSSNHPIAVAAPAN